MCVPKSVTRHIHVCAVLYVKDDSFILHMHLNNVCKQLQQVRKQLQQVARAKTVAAGRTCEYVMAQVRVSHDIMS